MKKNSNLLILALLTIGMGMTSCEGALDDILGEWSRPTKNPSETPESPASPLATPLTLEVLSEGAGTIVIKSPKVNMKYSKNGATPTTITSTADVTIDVTKGDKVAFYGDGTSITKYNGTIIAGGTAELKVYGNIMSLLDETGFATATTQLATNQTFTQLFYGNDKLKDANGLLLPAETLTTFCYSQMFSGCTALIAAPALPAKTLETYSYANMFQGCTSLTTAPELPATTVPACCYQSMFYGCTSLTTAPALPATTIGGSCYLYMFRDCTILTTAPELKATTLAMSCYEGMFYGCSSLTTAPELKATTLAEECYQSMFNGCTSLNAVTCLATNITATNCTKDWLNGAGTDASVTSRTLHIKTGQDPADTNWKLSTSGDGSSKKWTAVADR